MVDFWDCLVSFSEDRDAGSFERDPGGLAHLQRVQRDMLRWHGNPLSSSDLQGDRRDDRTIGHGQRSTVGSGPCLCYIDLGICDGLGQPTHRSRCMKMKETWSEPSDSNGDIFEDQEGFLGYETNRGRMRLYEPVEEVVG